MKSLRRSTHGESCTLKIKILVFFMLVGFMLGYLTKWSKKAGQYILERQMRQQYYVKQQINDIKDYLKRDERRELRK